MPKAAPMLLDSYIPTQDSYGLRMNGEHVSEIMDHNFAALRRPYFDKNGRPAVTVNLGRTTLVKGVQTPIKEHVTLNDLVFRHGFLPTPIMNATSLRKEEWIMLDQTVLKAARLRLRAWSDLSAANSFGGFDGMSKMILEHETMSDPGEAVVDMDGLTDGRTDSPLFQLEGIPLPITHSDFWYAARRLRVSRNSGTPLDATSAEAAGRRVAETIEKTTIGVETGVTYGGGSSTPTYGRTSKVYGYTNFTGRLTKTNLTTPTGSNAASTVADVLAMRQQMYNNKFYGPFMIYHSNDWDTYLDNDYILSGGNVATQTLRQRLEAITDIAGVRRLDYLASSATTFAAAPDRIITANPFTLIMVQMTSDVCRAVNGMDITTVQWESVGGMRLNFKVMAIMVPQIRADYYGRTGILHATTS